MEEHVKIKARVLLDLIFFARRYCDNRKTFAPSEFNKMYRGILSTWPDLSKYDERDDTLHTDGKYWPYAQDGDFNEDTSSFDARL